MLATKEQAIQKINELIEWFNIKKYQKIVNELENIKNNLENRVPTNYQKDLEKVLEAYKIDVTEKDIYREKCSRIITGIIFGVVYEAGFMKYAEILDELSPLREEWRKTQQNIDNISEITRKKEISQRARYYLYCFGYLISVEGSFSSWIKIIYRFICQIEGIPDNINIIGDWKPYKVEKKLIDIHPDLSIFFEGYFGGALRNAIGHGDFYYDDKTEKMHFHHIWNGEEKINEFWTFDEFYNVFEKILIVIDTGIEVIWLIRLFTFNDLFVTLS